jgi:hypothetical protein
MNMKYKIVKKNEMVPAREHKELQAELACAKAEIEELKAELLAINTHDCVIGSQCAFCEHAGTAEMVMDERYHFVTGYRPTCLLKQPCTHFVKKGDPIPKEGADNHD